MAARKRIIIEFCITEESVIDWQSIMRKMLDMPRIGFSKTFTPSELDLIEELAELSNMAKGKDVFVSAGNTVIEPSS